MSVDLILGPQVPIGNTWFDQTQVNRGRLIGQACPATPPSDPEAQVIRIDDRTITSFNFLHYYDLAHCLYIVHKRSSDASFLELARKCADSWYRHPQWIESGSIRLWPNSVSPAPRHAGILGLICRALDGRPDLWDWIHAYTRFHLDHWCKRRTTATSLFYGVREGAFALHFAVALAATHPEASIRATYLADAELVATDYFGRLQKEDGSWRWDDWDTRDADGGTLVGITQPFMVGLLLEALIDLRQLTTNNTVKENIKNQILKACRHLYSGGPYRKDDPVPYDPSKRWRAFWYLYHGGTTVNPTKFARGGWSYPGNNSGEVQDARQSISTVVAAYGYAYQISGDLFFKQAGDELWDSAYGGTDGIRNFMGADAKGYNQNARRAGSYLARIGGQVVPPAPPPEPVPPPEPIPEPAPVPGKPTAQITAPVEGASVSGIITVIATTSDGVSEAYLIVDGNVMGSDTSAPFSFTLDTTRLSDGVHSMFVRAWAAGVAGDSPAVGFTVANAPAPEPPPPEPPPPEPPPPEPVPPLATPRILLYPSSESGQTAMWQAQAREGYRPNRHVPRPAGAPKGQYVEFVKF